MKHEYSLSVKAEDQKFISDLFGSPTPTKGTKVELSGVELEYSSTKIKPGISSSELVVNILISIGTGIPASLIANLIWNKLGMDGRQEVRIKEKRKILIKKSDYELFFSEEIDTHIDNEK